MQDSSGNQVTQAINVDVLATAPSSVPVITSTPPTAVRIGSLYSYPVQAQDPSGSPLTYSLIANPVGMTVDSTGMIQWTPTASQPGPYAVVLEVDNQFGGSAGSRSR